MARDEFRVRWKGRETGPYSLAELKRALARGELSTLHRAKLDGEWITLDRLIRHLDLHEPIPETRAAARTVPGEAPLRAAYFYCGLAFLLPGVGTLAALRTLRRLHEPARRKEIVAWALALTAAGILFWLFALHTLSAR